jgi:hypothetical protein
LILPVFVAKESLDTTGITSRPPLEFQPNRSNYDSGLPRSKQGIRSVAMQMIYNSPNYCVVEFPPQDNHLAMKAGGYEIVDKNTQREIFIDGALAAKFREHVQQLIAEEPSLEDVDEFLGQFDILMNQPVVLH